MLILTFNFDIFKTLTISNGKILTSGNKKISGQRLTVRQSLSSNEMNQTTLTEKAG